MATKNNPGAFDYYENAEPMFVLLARDKDAPRLVSAWADQREKDGEKPEKVAEARACALAMIRFRKTRAARLGIADPYVICDVCGGADATSNGRLTMCAACRA